MTKTMSTSTSTSMTSSSTAAPPAATAMTPAAPATCTSDFCNHLQMTHQKYDREEFQTRQDDNDGRRWMCQNQNQKKPILVAVVGVKTSVAASISSSRRPVETRNNNGKRQREQMTDSCSSSNVSSSWSSSTPPLSSYVVEKDHMRLLRQPDDVDIDRSKNSCFTTDTATVENSDSSTIALSRNTTNQNQHHQDDDWESRMGYASSSVRAAKQQPRRRLHRRFVTKERPFVVLSSMVVLLLLYTTVNISTVMMVMMITTLDAFVLVRHGQRGRRYQNAQIGPWCGHACKYKMRLLATVKDGEQETAASAAAAGRLEDDGHAVSDDDDAEIDTPETDVPANRTELLKQVQDLKARAAEIRAEALVMEYSIQQSKTQRLTGRMKQLDSIIEKWFHGIEDLGVDMKTRTDDLDDDDGRRKSQRSTSTGTSNGSIDRKGGTVREVLSGIISRPAIDERKRDSLTHLVWTSVVPPRDQEQRILSSDVKQLENRLLGTDDSTTISSSNNVTAATGTLPSSPRTTAASELQVLQVVDRLWELQFESRIKEDNNELFGPVSRDKNIPPSPSNLFPSVVYSRRLVALILACKYVDEQIMSMEGIIQSESVKGDTSTVGTETEITSHPPSRQGVDLQLQRSWSGRTETAVRARIKELFEERSLEMKRRMIIKIDESKKEQQAQHLGRTSDSSSSSSLQQSVQGDAPGLSKSSTSAARTTTGDLQGTASTPIVPMWVPSTFLPYIINSNVSTVGRDEIEQIKDSVLMGSSFYVTSTESIPGAALFRGNIRVRPGEASIIKGTTTVDGKEPAVSTSTSLVLDEIDQRMANLGLDDRVQLFLLPDPEDEGKSTPVSSSSSGKSSNKATIIRNTRDGLVEIEEAKPVILALSRALAPDGNLVKRGWFSRVLKTSSYPLAVVSTFLFALSTFSLNPTFLERLVSRRDLTVVPSCFPVVVGAIAIQGVHEAVGRFVAKKRQIKLGRSVPVPSIHFTTVPFFGCVTPFRSFPKNRAAILDFALSGPLTAIAVSLGLVISGIMMTLRATSLDLSRFPFMTVASMKSSFLLGTILSWLAPKTMMLPMAQPIPVHPFFVVGVSGMITNALNLLPIFKSDGGRACLAALGQRQAAIVSVYTLLLIISMSFSGGSSVYLTWMVLMLVLPRRDEVPPRDDCTKVDRKRLTAWLLSFLLALSILTPFPGYSKLAL